MRVFIGIDIPDSIKDEIEKRVISKLKNKLDNARFVKKDSLHLTLKFIGEVSDDKLEKIKSSLKGITFSPFKVFLSEIGFFPDKKRPRVMWIGVKDGVEEMRRIFIEIEERLSKFVEKEKREFSPHLTIARFKERKIVELNIPDFSAEFEVREFILFKSILLPDGAKYEKISSFVASY